MFILGEVMENDTGQNFFHEKNGKPLTDREYQVLRCIILGKSNTQIADDLSISVHTAKAHVCSILQKMSVEDRVQAAVKAVREGLA